MIAEALGGKSRSKVRKCKMANAYQVKNPDFTLSPYTGMSRQHYIDCAQHLLEKAF